MTSTLGTPPPPPPDAALTGPISQQPTGAISQQMTATGETGAQPQPTSPIPADLQTTKAAPTSTAANNPTTGVSSALTQTIAMAISLGLDQSPTNAAGWAKLADKYATSAGQNAVTVAEQQAPTANAGNAANTPQAPAGPQFAGGAGSQAGWASMVLQEAKLPSTQNNIENMIRWMTAEEPPTNWNHANNPLNINAGGSGFDQFPDLETSAKRTAQVISQSNMAGIYQALASNADASGFSAAVVASPWAESHYGGDPNHLAEIPVNQASLNGLSTINGAAQTLAQHQGAATDHVVQLAQSQLGVPYSWGGEAAGQAFDCSGLVQWVYGQAGQQLPRVAQDQYNATPKVQGGSANLQPGDLLFFGSGPNGIEHVGIYIGEGKMIDAPHTGADVRVDQVFGPNGQPTWANYVGATRPGDPSGSSSPALGSQAQRGLANSQQQYGQILQTVTAQLAQLNGEYPGIFATSQVALP